MSLGGLGIAGGPGSALRFTQTRGRIQGSATQGVNYPSPFFDIAHTYLPATVKHLFRWCRYYFLTNPLINATVFKLSEYPITDIIIEHKDRGVSEKWTEIVQDNLRYRAFQVEVGLDYHTYGNAFVGLGFPFHKYLKCQNCGWSEQAKRCRNQWVFTNYAFRLACPKCGMTGDAVVKDQYLKNASGIKLIRWNPEDIEIIYNEFTGDYTYFYTIPAVIRNDIIIGRKEIVEGVPQIFVQALKEQKGVIFSPDQIFHLRRPSLATQDRGWGMPLILPVLKDTYYLQLMKKAQEAILVEHIVPLRVVFPQPASGTADPFTSINLQDWRDHVAMEIARWRYDNNYIPILPLPIGNQTIGGEGKALMLTAEIREWSEQLCAGMGVPREFIFGGLSYAGSNVSMRMMENAFIGYVIRHKQLLRFIMQSIANFMEWPMAQARHKPFKMADDIQRKAFLFQMNQAGKVSDKTLLSDSDLDSYEENEIMEQEATHRMEAEKSQQLAIANVQGECQIVMSKYQAKAQKAMMEETASGQAPGEPGGADAALEQGGGVPGGQSATAPAADAAGEVQTPGDPTVDPTVGTMDPSQQFDATVSSSLGLGQKMDGSKGHVDLQGLAMMEARQIVRMDPVHQQLALKNIRLQSPEMGDLVIQLVQQLQQENGMADAEQQAAAKGPKAGPATKVDMRPMPEKLPQRRSTPTV
jgi:hypothetical protein